MKRKEISQPVSWKTGLLVAIIQIISGLVSQIPLGCALKRLGRCALTLETDWNLTPDILCRLQSFLLSRGKVTPSPRLIAPDEHGARAAALSITSARREGGRGLAGQTSTHPRRLSSCTCAEVECNFESFTSSLRRHHFIFISGFSDFDLEQQIDMSQENPNQLPIAMFSAL